MIRIKNDQSNFYLIPAAIILAAILISIGIFFSHKINLPKATPLAKKQGDFQPVIGAYAPLFSLKTIQGTEMSLENLRGKNVLLIFWTTWCGYSEREMSGLKQLSDLYRNQIVVLAINVKENLSAVKAYAENKNINFIVLRDEDGKTAEKYQVNDTPYHFFISKEGRIAAVWPFYASFENLKTLADELLKEEK